MTDKFFGDVDETASDAAEVAEEVTTSEEVAVEVEAAAETTEEVATTTATSLTHTALGIHLDPRGRYQVVKVKYDPVSKSAGIVENIEEAAMDKMSAEEIFKLSVVREGVFIN